MQNPMTKASRRKASRPSVDMRDLKSATARRRNQRPASRFKPGQIPNAGRLAVPSSGLRRCEKRGPPAVAGGIASPGRCTIHRSSFCISQAVPRLTATGGRFKTSELHVRRGDEAEKEFARQLRQSAGEKVGKWAGELTRFSLSHFRELRRPPTPSRNRMLQSG